MHQDIVFAFDVQSLNDILQQLPGLQQVRGDSGRAIRAVRYDSRSVATGDLYVAVNGRDDRALEFLPDALRAGAAAVIVDAPELVDTSLVEDSGATLVIVDDARIAMAHAAAEIAGHPERRLEIFGVTGTNGKTTTTFVLQQLLAAAGRKVGVVGTLGRMIGDVVPTGYTTPESPELFQILQEMIHAGIEAVAMEVSSHALSLHRVAGIDFAGAVFTNLTQDHLDFHDTIQAYRDAKKSLFDGLVPGRTGVVNIDDLYGREMVRDSDGRILKFGAAPDADALVASVRSGPGGSEWEVTLSRELGGGSMHLVSPLLGVFNVANVMGAFTLALAAGADRQRLVEAVAGLEPVPGRMETLSTGNGVTAVVDYAHTPDALENVLGALRDLQSGSGGRLITVFGCGGDRDRAKRPLMGAIAARLSDLVVVTSDNPRSEDPESIIEEIMGGIQDTDHVRRQVDRAAAIGTALDLARPGDVVLIAGKGHETYQIIGAQRRHFDDREVVRAWNGASVASRVGGNA